MKKIISSLLILNVVLVLLATSSAYALEEGDLPIKDSATTIVGKGTNIGGSIALPPLPTKNEFLNYFQVFECTNSNIGSLTDCSPASNNSEETNYAYKVYSDPLRSPKYKNLLNIDAHGKVKVYLKPPHNANICDFSGGGNYDNDSIRLSGYMRSKCSAEDLKWSAIHESAHIIQRRSPGLYDQFQVGRLANQDGEDCYEDGVDGPYIKTYRYRDRASGGECSGLACGGGSKAESFGEAIGMNVVCSPNKKCEKATDLGADPITNYPQKCAKTYDWVKENVYGGIDFFGLGGTQEDSSGFVYYCQMDPKWYSGEPRNCTLGQNGCVPTSIAMIVSSLGKRMTPPQLTTSLINYRGIAFTDTGCSDGAEASNIVRSKWFEDNGFRVSSNLENNGKLNLNEAKKALEAGGGRYILAGAPDYPCDAFTRCAAGKTSLAHEFVVTAIDTVKGTVTIRDPMSCNRDGSERRYDRERPANFVTWWHAYAIGKK